MIRFRRVRYFLFSLIFLTIYLFFGVNDYIFAKDIDTEFNYPLNIDIRPLVEEVRTGKMPSVNPINYYPYKYLTNSGKCTMGSIELLILVKSAMENVHLRNAVRQTWGHEENVPGKSVRVLFFLGTNKTPHSEIQKDINEEITKYNDIIQMNFVDAYYNNTLKTMMSFRWAYEFCQSSKYYLFSDDDMYISVRNLLEFVQRQKVIENVDEISKESRLEGDGDLFAGYVFESRPLRQMNSKWKVSLEEYPWNKWPRYVTAGAYVLSNNALRNLYAGSLFTKHFRFDDIYLGIVAKKLGIIPVHCPEFYYYKKPYTAQGYSKVIASHGYNDPEEMKRVWKEQNYSKEPF